MVPIHSTDVLPLLHTYAPAPGPDSRSFDLSRPVVPPRPSASVVLVRDGDHGLQTYLLQRHARMAFAPRMSVFPGGAVDPVDERAADDRTACALRETHEETGVVLDRAALRRWAHWTTPAAEPIRFDTVFFLAQCPADQQPADVSGEADSARWWSVAETVPAFELGILALLPPTLSILLELRECADVADALARTEDRVVWQVEPRLELDGEGRQVGVCYPTKDDRG